ncbi:MAG: hypothetical protein WC496_03480 [Phycisphaerae bacterium]|jgi:hypothetical protein
MGFLPGAGNLKGLFFGLIVCLLCSAVFGLIEPNQVLVLVNQNSPTSIYIAKLYRQYYPEITNSQILYLSNNPTRPDLSLPDCSGTNSTPDDEIITREEYEILIANPVRKYLIENNMVNSIYVIITTAGLSYRIEDTTYSTIITPAGGVAYASSLEASIDAASVEAELAILFQNDPNNPATVGYFDRVVNTYQGYRNSGIELFNHDILNNLNNLDWHRPRKLFSSHYPPWMEGDLARSEGVQGRSFSAGDMYLTCRLDGPKKQGQSAVFAVHDMLERSRRASSPDYGINPSQAVVVLDDAPLAVNHNYNRIYNVNRDVDYIIWTEGTQQPPNTYYAEYRDDYESGFYQMSGENIMYDILNVGTMEPADYLKILCDERVGIRTTQNDLGAGELAIAVACYGINGDEASNKYYILSAGPQGGALFKLAYGAVFCSIESFNAVTMFSDASSAQAKIIDFLTIGGCGAIGHAFEPLSDATIDTEFMFYNLLADSDDNGYADMTFIEAAFTGIPYVSWSEVVIGDPLMRIAYGPGGQAQSLISADLDGDGIPATLSDFALWSDSYLYSINDEGQSYNDLADLDKNGVVNLKDFAYFAGQFE